MKYIVHICRFLVGVLFIFSGLIKLNDPIGFSIKLAEYFSEDVLNLTFLEPFSLGIAIFVVIFEVILGVFLLIGYKPKFTVWSLLGMIVFFTFLTFYSAYFDKVKDCGCFGDAIPLTPWESFIKDIILLALILVLFFGVRYIKPLFSKFGLTVIALLSFIACLWFGMHVLNHLPVWDFRAYNVGANIQESMIVPKDAAKPDIDYYWKFNIDGEEQIIKTKGNYPDVKGEFVSYETEVIDEGYKPPILDFSIESEDENLTKAFLAEDHLIIIAMYALSKVETEGLAELKTKTDEAIKNGYTVIGLTASGAAEQQKIKTDYGLNFDFYLCDDKAIKTMVRSNPGIIKLNKGTITQKLHWNDVDKLELPVVEKKITPVKVETVAYFINEEPSTEKEIFAIDKEKIEKVDVIKDTVQLKELGLKTSKYITSAVKVTLKKE